jgi:hypothetical protein
MNARLDPRHTIGRIFGTDWTVANVAKLLRFNANQGVLRTGALTGSVQENNQDYLRRTSARHMPSGVTVTFRRLDGGTLQAGLCFAGVDDYFPWNEAWSEIWLAALFGADRPRVRAEAFAETDPVRYFTLSPSS